MKLCYALRRGVFYPSTQDLFGTMPPKEHRPRYLQRVKAIGFDGVEIPVASADIAVEADARELGSELRDAGLPALCVRAGGPIGHPTAGPAAREKLERSIRYAKAIGATVINTTFVTPATHPGGPGADRRGEPVSQGGSRYATMYEFEETAKRLREAGQLAADLGLDISIEVHQGSIADNSKSTLLLLDMVGLENVGANPDLGNIYWHYEFPEETCEEAILALAPRSKYWHCKNLRRLHIPELHKSWYIRVPLDDGDIDYRFAISAMADAGYQGYLAVEGAQLGDQLTLDARSAQYVRRVLSELE
ncbi:MAG: sugar phosphate isomerase/epimerase [Chloroflexota bacterium]|nr:sugar phosphate isomerase/epimerase [Chloroflexota bacterium]